MTAAFLPSPEHLLVAIDIAKRLHDVLVRWPDGRERAFKIQSTLDEHEALCTFLTSHNLPVIAALEPTADFHRTLAWRLSEAGIEVHLASSLAGARVQEALYTSWDKHDRKDGSRSIHCGGLGCRGAQSAEATIPSGAL